MTAIEGGSDARTGVPEVPHPPVVAVAIPAYNEDRFIGSIVLKARRHVDKVLVVDDGSPDRTAEVALAAGAEVIRHSGNRGKAAALNTAFRWALEQDVTALAILDGDGQHEPDAVPLLVAPVLRGEVDMVVGTRFGAVKSAVPGYRNIGQRLLNAATNLLSGTVTTDSQGGFRAFSRTAIERMKFRSEGFAVESEMQFIAQREKLRLGEVPIRTLYLEPAKRNALTHGAAVLTALLNMVERQRPLLAFGFIGGVLLLAGLFLGLHITVIYSQEQRLAVGLGLITIALTIAGTITIFVGIILHALRTLLDDLRER